MEKGVEKKVVEVVGAVIIDNGKLFATQRGYGDFKDKWEFPGGKIEAGETKEQALTRELKEELDIDVSVGKLIKTIEYDYPRFHLILHCMLTTIIGGVPSLLEHESSCWVDKNSIDSLDWLPADFGIVEEIKKYL